MLKLGTLFSGIGAPEQALQSLGIKHQIALACDNDPFVKQTYLENYKCNEYYDDIQHINKLPKLDMLVFGFPCQPFSIAGKGLGLKDPRGKLLYNTLNLIETNPPEVVIAENVEGFKKMNGGKTLTDIEKWFSNIGYNVQSALLNALDFGIPHNRTRLFIVATKIGNFKFPSVKKGFESLKNFLSPVYDSNVYATEDFLKKEKVKLKLQSYKNDYINCITRTISRNGSSGEYISYVAAVNHAIGQTRKPTTDECRKLFGFNNNFKFPHTISNTRKYNMFANSMVVPVVREIISGCINK